ncbi:MAG: flagellar protein FlgN [Chitinivibrionia bacterium]|nr:flagellar protein FlgN [Chitinivibrionia bacterium]
MDKDISKKFKTIINQQILLQDQLKNMIAQMNAAITNANVANIKTISEEIDYTVEQIDTLERDRIELLSPYIQDKNRLKRIDYFIGEFPKDDIENIKKLHSELKEKSTANFQQTRINQILLEEVVLDIRKNVEIISSQVNRPIKYGLGGEKLSALPVHLVNQRG